MWKKAWVDNGCTRRAEKYALSTSEKSSLSSATGLQDDCCE